MVDQREGVGWEEMSAKDFVGTLRQALAKKSDPSLSKDFTSGMRSPPPSLNNSLADVPNPNAAESTKFGAKISKAPSSRKPSFQLGQQREIIRDMKLRSISTTAALHPARRPAIKGKPQSANIFTIRTNQNSDQKMTEVEDDSFERYQLRRSNSEPYINSWDYHPFKLEDSNILCINQLFTF